MGRARCEHCGAARRRTAQVCASCGQTPGPAEISIDPIPINAPFTSATPGSRSSVPSPSVGLLDPATPEGQPPERKDSRGWIGLAIAAMVILIGLFFFDDGARDEATPEADADTTAAPTPTTSEVAVPSSTSVGNSSGQTTTTADPTPLVVEEAALGVAAELVAIGVNGSLYGISLEDGGWTQGVDIEARPRDTLRPFVVVGDGLALRRSPEQVVLLRPPYAPAWEQPWTTRADLVVPADSDDRFGTMIVPSLFENRIARIFDIEGERLAETELPPNADLIGVVGDDFLLGFAGKTVRFDPVDRTTSVVAEGRPLFFDGRNLLWESCDEALRCTARSGPIDDVNRTEWPLFTPLVTPGGPAPLRLADLDPSGTAAISLEIGAPTDNGRIVFHNEGGTAVHILPSDVFQTTAELVEGGSWVIFHVFRSANVLAWNPVTDERRMIPFPRQLMGFALRD